MRSSFVCAIAASITLAGCAGAGGGVLSSTKTPPLNATQDARTAVQAAMSPVSTGDLTSGLFGGAYGQPLVITSNVKTFQALSQQCVDRHEFFVTQISADETKYETKFFYDQACTQLANDVVADVTIPDASDESIVRKATWYDKAGTQLANRNANFGITGSPGNFAAVLTSAFYVGSSTQPTNQFGGQLTVAPQNSSQWTIAGDHADILNDVDPKVNASFGISAALDNVTASVDGSGDVTFAGARTLSLSAAQLYGLTMPSAPPFQVEGGTVIGTGNASGSIEFDAAGQLMAVNVDVTTVKATTSR